MPVGNEAPNRFGPRVEPQRRPSIDTMPVATGVFPNFSKTAGGVAITVYGRHFANNPDGSAPTVRIAGVVCTSVVVVDQYSLTAVTPGITPAGVYDLSVRVGTQINTLYGCFTIITGQIMSLTPDFGPIAGGTSVLIEGFNFVNGTLVLFDGFMAADILFIDERHITCTTPQHSVGFVTVQLIEPALG